MIPNKPGVYPGLSFPDYGKIDAVNWHLLEPYRESAKEARHKQLVPVAPTKNMEFGEKFHTMVLEPDRYEREYCVMPEFEGHHASTKYKQARDAWLAANNEKVAVSREDQIELKRMAEAANQNPLIKAILSAKGRNELSIIWKDKETGILCKGRIDRLCRVPAKVLSEHGKDGEDIIVAFDLKTTRSVNPEGFDWDAYEYGYHGQLAWYADGLMQLDPTPVVPIIGAVQDSNDGKRACDAVAYIVPDDALAIGRKLYRWLLSEHVRCTNDKRWPGVCESRCWLSLPEKAKKEVEHVG